VGREMQRGRRAGRGRRGDQELAGTLFSASKGLASMPGILWVRMERRGREET
jgi:hypothetical protein